MATQEAAIKSWDVAFFYCICTDALVQYMHQFTLLFYPQRHTKRPGLFLCTASQLPSKLLGIDEVLIRLLFLVVTVLYCAVQYTTLREEDPALSYQRDTCLWKTQAFLFSSGLRSCWNSFYQLVSLFFCFSPVVMIVMKITCLLPRDRDSTSPLPSATTRFHSRSVPLYLTIYL